MPTFYNFTENGVVYNFDDVFVPSDLFRDGNLWSWGRGNYGQLGNGVTTGNISTPVTTLSGGTDWKQVSSGGSHTAAIKTDGTLWTWGRGSTGLLGNAQTTNRSTPVTTFAGGTNWKQVSAGYSHTVAIKTDGTLWSWGQGGFGNLGNAAIVNSSTPVTTFAGGTNWKQVGVGRFHTTAIKTDGTLWTWGIGTDGRLGNGVTTGSISTPVTTFAGGNNWKQVGGGNAFTTAIKTDGTLWTWGYNGNLQLGNNAAGSVSTPVTTFAGGTNWKQVSGSDAGNFTAAIKTDGTLWTWGRVSDGQLGNAVTTAGSSAVSTPVTTFAGGNNWKQVSAGGFHTAAIKTDGTLWTWGAGLNGKLGNGVTTGNVSTPVTTFAGGNNWKQVSASGAGSSGSNANTAALTYQDPGI
jgi:alpha-tubulin suppressor-like RCC1 family protein